MERDIINEVDTDDLVDELDNRSYFEYNFDEYIHSLSDETILEIVENRKLIPSSFAEYIGATNSFSYTRDELKQLAIDYIDKNF